MTIFLQETAASGWGSRLLFSWPPAEAAGNCRRYPDKAPNGYTPLGPNTPRLAPDCSFRNGVLLETNFACRGQVLPVLGTELIRTSRQLLGRSLEILLPRVRPRVGSVRGSGCVRCKPCGEWERLCRPLRQTNFVPSIMK